MFTLKQKSEFSKDTNLIPSSSFVQLVQDTNLIPSLYLRTQTFVQLHRKPQETCQIHPTNQLRFSCLDPPFAEQAAVPLRLGPVVLTLTAST